MNRMHRGFTLIEVMIAMLVLSLGLLGIAGTMVASLHSASSNYLKQQAVQTSYDIADRMRSNALVASTPNSTNPYIVSLSAPSATAPASDCASTTCNAMKMAAYDVWQWQTTVKNSLPGGLGSISVAPDLTGNKAVVTITVQWSDQPAQATFNAASTVTNNTLSVITTL
ncbi:MAG TPA: type IV pilus modification protein PilV [Rhodanobacter sp.]|jgi:type IV pilus assembly protein PilV|nr:type IV pilus modification protein PilV [Rhodanobacter sp.]